MAMRVCKPNEMKNLEELREDMEWARGYLTHLENIGLGESIEYIRSKAYLERATRRYEKRLALENN